MIASKQARSLGVTSAQRNSSLPDVPAIGEVVPGFVATSFLGLLAPAGTPPAVVARLNAAVTASLQAADVKARMASSSVDPAPGSPEQFASFLASESKKWEPIVHNYVTH